MQQESGVDLIKLDFEQARSKHLLFKTRLRSILYGVIIDEGPVVSHYECTVGKWIYGHALQTYAHIPEMHQMEQVHAQLHIVARKLVEIYKEGNIEEAKKGLDGMEIIADEMIDLLSVVESKVQESDIKTPENTDTSHLLKVNLQELRELQKLNQELDQRIRKQSKDLFDAKERFELVAKATQDAIWDWNLITNEIWWNEGFKELFGYAQEDIEPTVDGWYNRLHPQDREWVVGGIHNVIDNGGKNWSAEYRFQKKDGSYAIVLDRSYALHDAEGKPYRMLGSMQDITKRKATEEAVKQSEQRFLNLVREATIGIIILIGEEMKVEVVNNAYGALIGRMPEELIKMPLFQIIPEAEEVFRPILNKVLSMGTPIYLYDQPYLVHSTGKKIEGYLNLVYQPYKEVDGTTTGVMALCQDVTPQVIARKKAEEAEETTRLAIASAELGTFDVDLLSNEIVSSQRLDHIFDVEHISDRARYISAIHADDQPIRNRAYQVAFQNGLLEYEARIKRKDHSVRWIRVKGRIFFDDSNKPIKLLGVAQDITEEKEFTKELERQVTERTAEVEISRKELEKYVVELKRSNTNLQEFAYAASHDLKEPIRKIHFFSDRIKSALAERLSDVEKHSFERLEAAAKRMGTLIEDLLSYSEVSLSPAIYGEVNLNEIIDLVLKDLDLEIETKNATVSVSKLFSIKGHHRQLQQAFLNLISNSLKYSKPEVSPQIFIDYHYVDGNTIQARIPDIDVSLKYHVCMIRDNGIGFEQTDADRIFNVFTRLHGNKQYKGTGVGLSIARKVFENHNGFVIAESKPGEGSTFKVYLPEV